MTPTPGLRLWLWRMKVVNVAFLIINGHVPLSVRHVRCWARLTRTELLVLFPRVVWRVFFWFGAFVYFFQLCLDFLLDVLSRRLLDMNIIKFGQTGTFSASSRIVSRERCIHQAQCTTRFIDWLVEQPYFYAWPYIAWYFLYLPQHCSRHIVRDLKIAFAKHSARKPRAMDKAAEAGGLTACSTGRSLTCAPAICQDRSRTKNNEFSEHLVQCESQRSFTCLERPGVWWVFLNRDQA